ncbi:toxic anion resistance protein [Oscillospiraceae bacterium MB24-C1]|nr:toxic anion resistance protein [Oscillospiraceae bacterium MB24-C1]
MIPTDPSFADAQSNLLSPKEQQMINEFTQKIDLTNSNTVLQYGTALQKKIAGFSETALENVRTKDLGETGGMITDLIATLKGFSLDEEKPKGLMGLFKKGQNRIDTLKIGYNKAEENVEKISTMLEQHQLLLFKDISTLDKLYDMNLSYFKELSMYILAGKKKLAQERETVLATLLEKAKLSNLPEDAQAANDFGNLCDRFEKKISDLELTRMVSIQMAPQIRLLQNNNTLMVEKIQSTIVNTIPLWKSQMVLALGLAHSQQAMQAQRAVSDMTNELLRKNAEMLKTGTIETAREAQRGIVDLETLQNTNTMLISTLDEVQQIQAQGREKRRAIESELFGLESQLKQKLLDLKG